MQKHLGDLLVASIGLLIAFSGATAAYNNITGPSPNESAYYAWLILTLSGGMLLGVAVNKVSLRIKAKSPKKRK